jgi:hypothetical protein
VFQSIHEWVETIEDDGDKFEDGQRVEWVMESVLRGVKETFAPPLYQASIPVELNTGYRL